MSTAKELLDRDIIKMLKSALKEYMETSQTIAKNIEDVLKLTINFQLTRDHVDLEIALLNLDYELYDHFEDAHRHVQPFAWD